MQVNAQTKSGSNELHGSLYGYFRNDTFNASDSIAHRVLPVSDQQFGGTVGGPILKDKLFFFFAYEGERQPNTVFDTPTGFAGQSYSFLNELRTHSYLLRTDWQTSSTNRLSLRATASTRNSYTLLGDWTWTATPSLVNEVRVGYNHFDCQNTPLVQSSGVPLPHHHRRRALQLPATLHPELRTIS